MALRLLLALLVAPLLLAPVRLQQGGQEILLQPGPSVAGQRGIAAVALPSPTLIAVSPTRAPLPVAPVSASFPLAQLVKTEAAPAPAAAAQASVANTQPTVPSMTAAQAALCVRTLSLVIDLATVSMKQSGREGLVPLTIAATINQAQAAQGQWPNLALLGQAGVPLFTPNRAELQQSLGYATSFCRNPAAGMAGGSAVARPR